MVKPDHLLQALYRGAPLERRRLSPLARLVSTQILLHLTRRGNEQGRGGGWIASVRGLFRRVSVTGWERITSSALPYAGRRSGLSTFHHRDSGGEAMSG